MNSKRHFAALAIILSLSAGAIGQNPKASESDTLKTVRLKDVVVTSLKVDTKLIETPAQVSVISSLDCKQHASFTVADVLKYEPGLSMGGDGVWATNINVRGLSENRLVTLIDGNRVETATDLTASLSMIDVNDIQRVEVIKGAQSSLYGSGAMGGIVNIITKEGYFSDKNYFHGNATGSYASVNNSHSEYLSLNAGGKRWFVKVNGSYGHANDIKTPEGILANSGYTTNNLGAKMGFKMADNQVLKLQFQRNWSNDVGIPGGAAFAATAKATYTDIGRTLFNGSYEITDLTESFKSLKVSGFYQYIVRDVEMIPNTKPTETTMPNGMIQITAPQSVLPQGNHETFGGQVQGTWKFGEHNTFVAGIDAWRRNITSNRVKNIDMTVVKPTGDTVVNKVRRVESPFPNASFTSTGLFAQDEMSLCNDRLILTLGGRFDGIFVENETGYDVDSIFINGELQPMTSQRVTFEAGSTKEPSWSANLGLLYKVGERTELVMNMARSYRAASLEERFKYIDLGSKVQLGNPNLKPEKGYSADLGIRHWGDRFNVQFSVFANRLTDMITEVDGKFVYHLTGDETTSDTLPALIYSNVDKALLYGCDFSASYFILSGLQVYMSGAYIVGRDIENDQYLPYIPPMNGRLGVAYNYPRVGGINLSVMAAGAKEEGKIAAGEKATKGYYRLDLSLNSRMFELGPCGLQFFGGIDNLTNETYTNFLSTNRGNINYEPARNFYIRANITF